MPYRNAYADNPGMAVIDSPAVLRSIGFRPTKVWVDNPYGTLPVWKAFRFEAIIGLTEGYGKDGKALPKGVKPEEFKPEEVRDFAKELFPDGGTLVAQLGWWAGRPESSVRLIMVNVSTKGKPFNEKWFVKTMNSLVRELAAKFRQSFVPVFYFRREKLLDQISYSLSWSEK